MENKTVNNNGLTLSIAIEMLRRFKNHAEIYGYPSESFKIKVKKYLKNKLSTR